MQAQGIRPNDFRFGTQKDAVALAAKAVRRRGWDLSNNGVWEWLAGLAEGATSAGRAEFAERSVVREFARYLVALNSSADCGKADRLSNEVARAARSEIAALGSYAQQDGAES